MFERSLWDLALRLMEEEKAEIKRQMAWVRATYAAELEAHTASSIHRVEIGPFFPSEPRRVRPRYAHYAYFAPIQGKSLNVWVDRLQVKAFESTCEFGAMLPWIAVILRKRTAGKGIAWMLGMTNATNVGVIEWYEGMTLYSVRCQRISEMMPKSLVSPPEEWSH